ncbi:hypothetical protein P3T32_002318 [Ralstonia sp. GP73]|uniref:hypothetical protein n=1 Tax=unclassified Ralstonia TaxID=209769 RepID=UPI002475BA08|nr:hypothetical protein [Ralstonia sp. GP73]MDH6642476.1 hypothetical protein [Ralstonia sp. GP73]
MPVIPMKAPVRVERLRRVWVDLLIGPVAVAMALAMSLLVPVRAYAQTNMTLQQLVPNLIRNISQTVTASPSGLTVLQAGQVDIGVGAMNTGTGIIGRVMINEGRGVAMASIASRAVGLATPIALTMIAADLISYGIKQCQTSPNGWCKPGQANAASGDTGFNGYAWYVGSSNVTNQPFSSPAAACQALVAVSNAAGDNYTYSYAGVTLNGDGTGRCSINIQSKNSSWTGTGGAGLTQATTCVSGYVMSGGNCVPDPNVNVPPQPITYPELASNLGQVLSGNPNRAKDYWGIMPPDQWYAALGDPSTQALPAQIVSPANGQVVGPKTTTTSPAGTTTTQQTVTVSPNTNTATLAANPVTVTTTTTTTNPDGTTTTTTTSQDATSGGTSGGGNPQPQPASSPVPCGLGSNGSPKCLIDETGTPTDGATSMAKSATDLQTAEQTAEAQLQSVNNNRSWNLTMPHILPGGSCQPIEWFAWGTWRGSWDVCTQLQYVHDLLAWLWPVLSAVYVWNKAAGANAGAV